MTKIRDPDLHSRKIHMIFPRVFYRRCKVCGYEFKNVVMWKWIDDWYWEGDRNWAYACTSCVHDLKDLYPHIYGFHPKKEVV